MFLHSLQHTHTGQVCSHTAAFQAFLLSPIVHSKRAKKSSQEPTGQLSQPEETETRLLNVAAFIALRPNGEKKLRCRQFASVSKGRLPRCRRFAPLTPCRRLLTGSARPAWLQRPAAHKIRYWPTVHIHWDNHVISSPCFLRQI